MPDPVTPARLDEMRAHVERLPGTEEAQEVWADFEDLTRALREAWEERDALREALGEVGGGAE